LPGDDFEFTFRLSISDRKQLTNLKQGDSRRLTAGPLHELPLRLREVSYDGNGVSVTFNKDAAS
jgi:hypothetical protein